MGEHNGSVQSPCLTKIEEARLTVVSALDDVERYAIKLDAWAAGHKSMIAEYIDPDPFSGAGAHSQGETLDELHANLQEVITLLLDDGEPKLDTEFVGTQTVIVA